jgi:hypothetical protein
VRTSRRSTVDVLRDNQEITALDFNYGPTIGHSDAFLLGVKNTIACKQKFPIAKNPVSARPVVSRAKMRWLR